MSTSARNVWRIGAVTGVTVVEQKMTVMPVRLFPKASEEGCAPFLGSGPTMPMATGTCI